MSTNSDPAERLVTLIKAGKLKITSRNLHKIQMIWCNLLASQTRFKMLGLDFLPDPEGRFSQWPQLIEDQLVSAFAATYGEEEARRRFHLVRNAIIKDVEKER